MQEKMGEETSTLDVPRDPDNEDNTPGRNKVEKQNGDSSQPSPTVKAKEEVGWRRIVRNFTPS